MVKDSLSALGKAFSLVIWSLSALPPWIPPLAASPTVAEIQRTGILKIAVREDAPPFAFRDGNSQWTGLCFDLIELLRRRLQQELPHSFLLIQLLPSTLFNRFELVDEGEVALECGANGIRPVPYQVTFSTPIFLTGTRFLIRSGDRLRVNPNGSLKDVVIGFLADTSNAEFVQNRYPQARFQEFRGMSGRKRGVQAVQQNKIDAFASDGILLLGEALLLDLALGQDYIIVPRYPLNCEEYGLILPAGDRAWAELVNGVLQTEAAISAYQKWFGEVESLLTTTQKTCGRAPVAFPKTTEVVP
jgi:polar amino acid transport system substrate-binding protein